MKKILFLLSIVNSILFANSIAIESIGINVGKANSNTEQTNKVGTVVLVNNPNESYESYEIFAIAKEYSILNIKVNPYLSYSYNTNIDLKHKYILLGANKYYNSKDSILYVGANIGYGELKWKYNPLNSSQNNIDANSFIVGVQTGIEFEIDKNYSLGLNAKYLAHKYETILEPDSTSKAEIETKHTSSLAFSLKYSF